MKKVLHIVFQMNRGGMENRIMDIYRNIDRNKIQFDFIEHTAEKCTLDEEIMALGGNVYRDNYSRRSILKAIKFYRDFFSKTGKEYDFIHIHESHLPNINFLLLYYAKQNKKAKFIIHSRNASGPRILLHNIVKRYYNKKFDYHIACSAKAAKWMFSKQIIMNSQYTIWNNAIDAEKFRFNNTIREKMRRSLDIAENNFVIGHIGNFKPQKNHSFLIDIFYAFEKKHPNCLLLLIGEGPLRETISNKIDELGLIDKVLFTGTIANTWDFYQAMDCFILPSLYEGLPGVGVEAQASGLPSIFSDKISKEVQIIPNNIFFHSIENGVFCWVKRLEQIKAATNNRETLPFIRKAGFDCKFESKKIEEFYLEG